MKRKKDYEQFLVWLLVAVLLIGLPLYTVMTQKDAAPFQFQEQTVHAAALAIGGAATTQPTQLEEAKEEHTQQSPPSEDDESDEQQANNAQTEEDTKQAEDKPADATGDKNRTNDASVKPNASTPSNREQQANSPADAATGQPNNTSSPETPGTTVNEQLIEIVENGTAQHTYFVTNITDKATVTEAAYYVTVTHVQPTLTVKAFDVRLNEVLQDEFTGTLTLTEGENTIQFQVTYVDEQQKEIHVSQQYTLFLNTKDVVITTSLTNSETTNRQLSFIAKAERSGAEQPLTVSVNGRTVKSIAGTAYEVTLQPGKNDIVLTANDVKNVFTITYNEVQQAITIDTSLKNARVTEEQYTFTATATYNKQYIPLTVTLNEATVEADDNGRYAVQLQAGTNVIQLRAEVADESIEQTYKILYNNPNAPPVVVEKDVLAPTIKTDLVSGAIVKGSIKTINVWPTTADGERIRGKNVAVRVNGTGVPFTWDDSTKTSYKLTLQTGKNHVSIKVWDEDGRTTTEEFDVVSEAVGDNGIIGQATISLEASTLGIPYLIPPTKVDIREGEKGSYIIDQFLRHHGFTYYSTGTMESNFYLQSIRKPNMLQQLNIPNDLWALVETHSSNANRTDYDINSLSEFDFANGSGWMYSINGDYPNYGLADAYFLDGDVVRIRFTLHYGKDIKGYGGIGSNNGDWSKEW